MSNIIKYGQYWIAAGIAVTGVLWFNRPLDPRIKGEDVADLFEASMERVVLPYTTEDEEPDYYYYFYHPAGLNPSNIVSSLIKYEDIARIGYNIGQVVLQSDGWVDYKPEKVYWTTNDISGATYEPSEMSSGYDWVATTNENGVETITYSYSTNTCKDVLLTTATRIINPPRGDVYKPGMVLGAPIDKVNLPISKIVFPENEADGIKDISLYHFWPFAEPYIFPWEQLSWRNSSRVVVFNEASANVTWTNICWIGTNSLSIAFGAYSGDETNGGFSVGSFYSINGFKSVPFAFVKPPTVDAFLSISTAFSTEDSYVINKEYSDSSTFWQIRSRDPNQQSITVEQVYGRPLYIDAGGAGPSYYDTEWGQTARRYSVQINGGLYSNNTAILKLSLPLHPEVSPMYLGINIYSGTPIKTNAHFSVLNDLATTSSPTGTATTNALLDPVYTVGGVDLAKRTDDKRITTNKLDGLRQVLTNLYRTVYFSGVGALVSTNCIITAYEAYDTGIVYTNLSGESSPVEYYYDGDGSEFIADFVSSAVVTNQTTNSLSVGAIFQENFIFSTERDGVQPTGEHWYSYVRVGGRYRRWEYEYNDVTLKYPSIYAITNGYVKSVKVYAVYENEINQFPSEPSQYTTSVSGNYWTHKNIGTSVIGIEISVPREELPDTRELNVLRDYPNSYNMPLSNRAIYNKIFEIDDPTEAIYFDLGKATVTGADFGSKMAYHSYSYDEGAYTGEEYDYGLDYTIGITRFMIVVDWNFQHLGRGFEPVTNSPSWR